MSTRPESTGTKWGDDLKERWERERPEREARRASRGKAGKAADKVVCVGSLLLVLVIALATVVLVALLVWAVVQSWKVILVGGGAIAVVVCVSLVYHRIRG